MLNNQNLINIFRDQILIGILLLIFLGVILPFHSAIMYFTPLFFEQYANNFVLYTFILFAGLLLYKAIYQNKMQNKTYWLIMLMLGVGFCIVKLWFVFSFEQEYFSDFRTMWNFAKILSNSSEWITPTSPQTQRPLVSHYPLIAIFGSSTAVFKLFNVLAITAHNLIIAFLAMKWFSKQASIICFIILSFVPEFYFASLIPSHDIPGSLYLALCILVGDYILTCIDGDNYRKAFFASILLSVIGLFLDIQRSTFIFYIGAMIVFLFLRYSFSKDKRVIKKHFISIALIVLLPFFISSLTKSILQKEKVLYSSNSSEVLNNYLSSFCNLHSMSSGNYQSCIKFYKEYGIQLEYEDKLYYTKVFAVSSFYYDFLGRVNNYHYRAQRISKLGTQGAFYYGRLQDLSEAEESKIVRTLNEYNIVFVFVFSCVFLALVILLFIKKSLFKEVKLEVYLPLIFMGLVVLALGLFGENQPRYLFMGWGLWSLTLVGLLEHLFKINVVKQNQIKEDDINNGFTVSALIVFILLGYICYSIFKFSAIRSDLLMQNMQDFSPSICSKNFTSKQCEQSKLNFRETTFNKKFALLQLKHSGALVSGAFVMTELDVKVDGGQEYDISLYVQSPYKRDDGKKDFFDVNIYIDDKLQRTLNLSDNDKYHYVKMPILASTNNLKIKLEVVSNFNRSANSWKNASLTNFKFLTVRKQ